MKRSRLRRIIRAARDAERAGEVVLAAAVPWVFLAVLVSTSTRVVMGSADRMSVSAGVLTAAASAAYGWTGNR